MDVIKLTQDFSEKYESFILGKEDTMLYASLVYRDMLMDILGDEDYYLIAIEKDLIVGALPCFIHRNKKYGNVINSLPYYGSNGGIIADSGMVSDALVSEFKRVTKENQCVSSTIIGSPFNNNYSYYSNMLKPDMISVRRGVITHLPCLQEGGEEELKRRIHGKKPQVLSDLRKARRNGVSIAIENTHEAFDFLKKTHNENMSVIGGPAKRDSFFEYVQKKMIPNKEYNLFVARMNNQPIASLLLFYFNKTVEYYVPVVVEEYRTYQALSLIIYEAMIEAMNRGYKNWNWGGTGMTMDGVFRFKMKWAAMEYDYNYYTNIYDKAILKLNPKEVLTNYPNYYVFNFT